MDRPDKEDELGRVGLLQIGYTSEWALAKFFPAIFDLGLSEYFNLVGVCGRELNKNEAISRLYSEISNKVQAIQQDKTWRLGNIHSEIRSALTLIDHLSHDRINYYRLPDLPSEGYDAAVIHTSNFTHLNYISELAQTCKHILCEKPLVTVTDENHEADSGELESLEQIIKGCNSGLILMDSEHYSAKTASLAFFRNIGDMVARYGRIKSIEGHLLEIDDHEKIRTRNLLCRQNKTGLLLDVGVHLFAMITSIEGNIGKILDAQYGIFPGRTNSQSYDVETYVNTKFEIHGHLFHDRADGTFTFAKFIKLFEDPLTKDDKRAVVTFVNKEFEETEVYIDFSKGIVTDSNGFLWYTDSSSQEYVNILRQFANAIIRGQAPRTCFEHSMGNLNAIYRVYRDFPIKENIIQKYRGDPLPEHI